MHELSLQTNWLLFQMLHRRYDPNLAHTGSTEFAPLLREKQRRLNTNVNYRKTIQVTESERPVDQNLNSPTRTQSCISPPKRSTDDFTNGSGSLGEAATNSKTPRVTFNLTDETPRPKNEDSEDEISL